jgi:hypothetical protein
MVRRRRRRQDHSCQHRSQHHADCSTTSHARSPHSRPEQDAPQRSPRRWAS